jgi:hypothetical protein
MCFGGYFDGQPEATPDDGIAHYADFSRVIRTPPDSANGIVVELRGFEPLTSAVRLQRSPN